jgi:hypothetical protein
MMGTMTKFVVLLILLVGGVAYAGWYFAPQAMPPFLHPEVRACGRMSNLCNEPPTECEKAFAELRKISGDQSIHKPIKCMMSANNCAESAGCLAGAGVNAVMKAGEEFLKGLRQSVGE